MQKKKRKCLSNIKIDLHGNFLSCTFCIDPLFYNQREEYSFFARKETFDYYASNIMMRISFTSQISAKNQN